VEDLSCDVLVVGSGAGGLTAALSAAHSGLDVLVVEKTSSIGGTTAHSEGMIWVPLSPHAKARGVEDDVEHAFAYLEAVAGNHLDVARSRAYLRAAPEMLRFIEGASRLRYALAGSLDYHSDLVGASAGARSLSVLPMDARTFGPIYDQIRPPLRSTLAFGGMTIVGSDLPDVLRAHRSPRAFARMAGMTLRYFLDRARGRSRGARIGNGHALVACLVEALLSRGGRIRTGTSLCELIVVDGVVNGARVDTEDGPVSIHARAGVVLAGGGFSNDPVLKARLFDHVGRAHDHALLASEASAAELIGAAREAGADWVDDVIQPAAWTPASLVPQPSGPPIAFPHYIDRNKPGFIIVDALGRRFANEATTYHRFVAAMIEACRGRAVTEAWLIGDRRAVDCYGIGAAPPFPPLLRAAVRSGYITRAASVSSLASALGLPGPALQATVERFNQHAREGVDPDFHRGETAYERSCGDAGWRPNPNLGPLESGPFYAVRLVPSDIATFAGLRTDAEARVLRPDGSRIPGLFAVGNDAASPFGGAYPAAGITVGAAMTFGYIAGQSLAGKL